MKIVYLDNNATTAAAPEVTAAMWPYFSEQFGNPSSLHVLGQQAAQGIASARAAVARLIGAGQPSRILFTSGGTESNATALRAAIATAGARRRVVTTAVEHSAVLEPLAHAQSSGFEVKPIGVDSEGRLDMPALLAAIDANTALVSVMWANNETGVVHELAPIAAACRAAGARFHVDGVQACGKLSMRVAELDCDFVSVSSHKLHGPKGVGALYVRRGIELDPLLRGGPQEDERRGGTENVPGIVGFGRAAQLASAWLASDGPKEVSALRDRLEQRLLAEVPGCHAHAAGSPRVPNTTNVRFDGVSGEAIVALASDQGVCLSTGAACSSSRHRASHVLLALGLDSAQASSSIRASLSRFTSPQEIDRAFEVIASAVLRLRALQGRAPTEVNALDRSGPPAE